MAANIFEKARYLAQSAKNFLSQHPSRGMVGGVTGKDTQSHLSTTRDGGFTLFQRVKGESPIHVTVRPDAMPKSVTSVHVTGHGVNILIQRNTSSRK